MASGIEPAQAQTQANPTTNAACPQRKATVEAAFGFKAWIGFDSVTGRGVFVLLNSNAISPLTIGEKLLDMIP
jgi:hypothetical protein